MAEWAAHVDRKLLSFGMEGMKPTLRNSERTIELGGLLTYSDQLEDIFAEVPEARATFDEAQANLRIGTILVASSLGCLLLGTGLVIGALLITSSAAAVGMAVAGGVLTVVSLVLTLVSSSYMRHAQEGLFRAVEQYNHALLRVPPPTPPSSSLGASVGGGYVVHVF
ncbi:MAG: hypothetical protein AB1938_23920 [Myxococcota bacterium]